jgi:hypothetical protein
MSLAISNNIYIDNLNNNGKDYKAGVNSIDSKENKSDEVKLSPITKLKKKLLPAITESMELGREIGEDLAKINDYEVIKNGLLFIGLKEKKAHAVASGFSNREFNKYIAKTSIKVAEYIPSKYIEAKLTKEINNQVVSSISRNIPNTTTITDPKIKAKFKSSITEGNLKAVEKLKSENILSKSIDTRKEVKGMFTTIKDQGLKNATKEIKNTLLTNQNKKIIQSSIENSSEYSKHLLKDAIDNATQKAGEKISEKGFINVSSNTQKALFRKNVAKATENAINKTVNLTGVKIATNFTKIIPFVSTVAEGFVMYNDINHAIKLFNDKDASNISKGLAVSTVVFDSISLHSVLTGSLKRGVYASGLSVLTSIASNITR